MGGYSDSTAIYGKRLNGPLKIIAKFCEAIEAFRAYLEEERVYAESPYYRQRRKRQGM